MKSFTAYLLGTFLFLSAASAADIWTSIGATGTILLVGTTLAQVSAPKVSF
jgi:hypothetical protein